MNTQPLVTLVPWTMVAQFLNLMIQLYLIKRFLFKPINEILEKRRQAAFRRGIPPSWPGPVHPGGPERAAER